MSAVYSVFTSPNHPPVPNHLPTLIVTPVNNPQHVLYSYIHTSFNRETYLLTPSPQGDLCVAKMVPPPGSRGPGGPGSGRSDSSHSAEQGRDKTVRCEASRNLKWSITNTGIAAPVYKLTLPNPDVPGNEQPLFQISKPNPHANFWTMFYFTYAGHGIPPKRLEFGKIQKNAAASSGGGGGTRVAITGKTDEEQAVWQTLGEGNEDMVEWIVLCAALNLLDEEIIKAAEKAAGTSGGSALQRDVHAVPSSRPGAAGAAISRNGTPVTGAVPPMQIRPTKGPAPAPFRQGQPPQRPMVLTSPASSARPSPVQYASQASSPISPMPRPPSPYQQQQQQQAYPQQYGQPRPQAPLPRPNGYGPSLQPYGQGGQPVPYGRGPPSPVGYRPQQQPPSPMAMPGAMPQPMPQAPNGMQGGHYHQGQAPPQQRGAPPVGRHF